MRGEGPFNKAPKIYSADRIVNYRRYYTSSNSKQLERAMKQNLPRKTAFTLVELLVTIGILGTLASLTVTAVSRAILKSHAVVSQNNLRQLTAAYIGFDMETGEFPSFNQTRRGKWVGMIHNREDFPEEVFSSPASYMRHRMGQGSAREDWRMVGPESTYQHFTRM